MSEVRIRSRWWYLLPIGLGIRLASSYVDFDSVTSEPKIEKSSGDLSKLIKNLFEIIRGYPSSFNTN